MPCSAAGTTATLAELTQRGAGRLHAAICALFWGASALGARLSPLHGRFPIEIRPAAVEEARTLTAEKVSLAQA